MGEGAEPKIHMSISYGVTATYLNSMFAIRTNNESSIVAIYVAVPASAAVVAALPLTFSPLGQEPARFASVTSIGNTVYAARIDGVHVFEVAMSGALQRLGSVAELTEGFTVVGDALAIANRSAFLVYPAHCPGTFSIPMSY
jgi:hypothetical protein